MKVKKYVAEDFQSAIYLAKREMGKDAIILNSCQVKKKGFLGWFSKPKYEVTVAVDEDLRVETDKLRRLVRDVDVNTNQNTKPESPETSELNLMQDIQQMKKMMDDIRGKMYEVDLIKGVSPNVQKYFESLVANRVNQDIALRIVSNMENRLPMGKFTDPGAVQAICAATVSDFFGDVRPIQTEDNKKGKIVMMVGPTGVGKTTTIAKLAANMVFVESREAALITLDTYRVSAAEQLRTFAEIIGVPIKVVFNPLQLSEAIHDFRYKDIIFIDTAGRSPYNSEHMEELELFINSAKPDEIILVLSVNTETSDLLYIYEKFNQIGVDKIIFSKLDETDCYGQIINFLHHIHKPVAYFTTGQNVPDDIEIPDPLQFARMVLRKDEAQ